MRWLLAAAVAASLVGCDTPEQVIEQPPPGEQKVVMVPAPGDPRTGGEAPKASDAQGAAPSAPTFDQAQPGDR
jgi:hypothetical protein